jgi:hypothetical protein
MEFIRKIEDSLAGVFKSLPDLSEGGKEGLAKAFPWIALLFGILQFITAWGLLTLFHTTNTLTSYYNNYYQSVTGQNIGLSSTDKLIIYLSIAVLLVDGIILLMAYSPLSKRLRRGWDLMFLSALINLAYAILTLFIQNRGLLSFIGSLLGSAVAFYLLYQVRGKYVSAGAASVAPKASEIKDKE